MNNKIKFIILICTVLVVPLFLFMFKQDTLDYVTADNLSQLNDNIDIVDEKKEAEFLSHDIPHDEIIRLTNQFVETLVQDIDDNTYKVLNYDSKKDLLRAFKPITTQKIAKLFINAYYEEREDGLYIIPTSTPPWFVSDNEYDVVQLDVDTVKISQYNESDYHGEYEIELEFTFNKKWKITQIVYP